MTNGASTLMPRSGAFAQTKLLTELNSTGKTSHSTEFQKTFQLLKKKDQTLVQMSFHGTNLVWFTLVLKRISELLDVLS
jgi:hypothetical protein